MDDLKKKGAADRSKINLHEAWEVDHWTRELGVSKDELQKVVNKVGNSAVAVRKELGRQESDSFLFLRACGPNDDPWATDRTRSQ